jgi:hypothetical protein
MSTSNNTNPQKGLTEGERASLRRMLRYGATIFIAISITLIIVAVLATVFNPA